MHHYLRAACGTPLSSPFFSIFFSHHAKSRASEKLAQNFKNMTSHTPTLTPHMYILLLHPTVWLIVSWCKHLVGGVTAIVQNQRQPSCSRTMFPGIPAFSLISVPLPGPFWGGESARSPCSPGIPGEGNKEFPFPGPFWGFPKRVIPN